MPERDRTKPCAIHSAVDCDDGKCQELAFPELPTNDPRNIPAMAGNTWQPGQSGNPNGRPPRQTMEEVFELLLDGHVSDNPNLPTRRKAMATVLFDKAVTRSETVPLLALLDRIWPKTNKTESEVNLNAGVTLHVDSLDDKWRQMLTKKPSAEETTGGADEADGPEQAST